MNSIDNLFDVVNDELKHGDAVAIQMINAVYICELEDLPKHGVPKDGTIKFKGCKCYWINEDEEEWDCENERTYTYENWKLIKEER